ncbi:hypothetical protein EMCRGX_G008045 [Ephydatia muelleri]
MPAAPAKKRSKTRDNACRLLHCRIQHVCGSLRSASEMDSVKRLIETIGGKKSICPKEAAAQERRARSLICSNYSAPEVLPESRVRLVFSRDSDKKTLLFDSQANMDPKERVSESMLSWSLCDVRCGEKLEHSSGSNGSNGWKRLPFTRQPSTDSQLLGEMIFGSTPMKLHGDTLKVHYMKSTDQLMLTKVFSIRRRPLSTCNLSESESCAMSSVSVSPRESYSPMARMSEASLTRHQLFVAKTRSSSLNVPSSSSDQGLGPSSYNTTPSNHSPSASLGSNVAVTMSSSLNKRIQRARSTSMENWNYSSLSKKMPRSRVKFALAVIVCLSELDEDYIRRFQHFIFQHFSLIDAHLDELRESTEDAFVTLRLESFKGVMEQAYQKFLHNFLCLYSAQRIENPVWLSLVSQETNRKAICRQFMEELGCAISELDTKETKYFLSSVLTEVLSHHLAWIHTVSDLDTSGSRQSRRSKSLSVLAESHPYNPLWAQLGDLYGAVATPLTITRTVVTGQSAAVVCRLLYLLSYFIRCSEIQLGREFKSDPTGRGPTGALSSSMTSLSRAGGGERPRWDVGSDQDGSDVFEESRGSSLTLLSEHDRASVTTAMSPAASRDVPLVKPHPFSFKASDLHRFSHEDSDTQELASFSSGGKTSCTSPLSVGTTATPTPAIMATPLHRSQPEAVVENSRRSSCSSLAGNCFLEQRSLEEEDKARNCRCHGNPTPSRPSCHCHDDLTPSAEVLGRGKRSHPSGTRVEEDFSQETQMKSAIGQSTLGSRVTVTPAVGADGDTHLPPIHKPTRTSSSSSTAERGCYGGGGATEVQAGFSNSVDSGYDPSGPPLSRCSTLSSHLSSYQAQDDSLLEERGEDEEEEGVGERWTKVTSLLGVAQQPDPCLSLMLSRPRGTGGRPVSMGTGVFARSSYRSGQGGCGEGDSPRTAGVAMMTVPLVSAKGMAIGDHTPKQKHQPLPPTSSLDFCPSVENTPRVYVSLPVCVDGSAKEPMRRLDFDSLPATNGIAAAMGASHERMHVLHHRRMFRGVSSSSLDLDMEGSLPLGGVSLQHGGTSLLGSKLEQHDRSVEVGAVPRMNQFADFVPVALPSLQDFDLEEDGALFDFGHSLLVGHSDSYLPDFVLHGTSQPYSAFKEDLVGDLTNVIKHSIIDEPIEHGLAVVASTDTWTTQLVCVSKIGPAMADTSVTIPSHYIQQLLKSIKGMWEMRMPSEFCLSHLEDGLLTLNEKGKLLADTLSQSGSPDLGDELLASVQESLSIQSTDLPLLLSLAAVHCGDTALASTIRHKSLQVTLHGGRKISR